MFGHFLNKLLRIQVFIRVKQRRPRRRNRLLCDAATRRLTNWNTTGSELGESFHALRGRQVEGKQR